MLRAKFFSEIIFITLLRKLTEAVESCTVVSSSIQLLCQPKFRNYITKFCVIIWNEQRIKVIKVPIWKFFFIFRLKMQRLNDTQKLSDAPHKSQNMLQFNFLR